MKLDTSGLESSAPLVGASSGFLDGFADAPSFEVPTTNDVSCDVLVMLSSCVS